jgi:hypothetical protein
MLVSQHASQHASQHGGKAPIIAGSELPHRMPRGAGERRTEQAGTR